MASFGATYWPRGEGSWRSQVSSVQSENLESVLGSCPSFNDFSMHTHDDFSKEYQMNDLRRSSVQISREQKQTADLRRSSVPAVLRTYSSVDVLPENWTCDILLTDKLLRPDCPSQDAPYYKKMMKSFKQLQDGKVFI
eukprot:TRINITY_DN3896_c1_g4_i2.p2 TRINITY_DN3896_c1_g4~~TRINITY_DN3896_c1_g4_i2.p2  ORF type:complete len:138 (-),score=8.60 TRINITY_DN3896_c1_g4_i2:96-509(-)